MRTRQFQRFVHQKMNQKFPENLLPIYGISLKKNQKSRLFFKRKSKNFSTEKKKNLLLSKLLQVYGSLIHQTLIQTPSKRKVQPLFSLDQVSFEFQKGRSQKTSDFGHQLHERKKLRWFYGGLSTRTLRHLLREAKKIKVSSTSTTFQKLEKRLDVALYRCGFFESIYAARQWILQKRVLVNKRFVERGSYELQPGDVITIEKKWHHLLMAKIFERFLIFFKNSGNKINEKNEILFAIPFSQLNTNIFENQNVDFTLPEFSKKFFNQFSDKKRIFQVLKTKKKTFFYQPFHCMKPLHLEISYKTFSCIYLYPPQKIPFPSLIDVSAIEKSYSF